MQRIIRKPAILAFAILTSFAFIFATTKHDAAAKTSIVAAASVSNTTTSGATESNAGGAESEAAALYTDMNLGAIGLKQDVFSTAMEGFKKKKEQLH